ncbi:hypothetical protein AVEN_155701-1 [Araneus ventricosus]|uniref:Mos1 transposase HTH domain-containing protein n=1 Tax=Araneus ventricosus TaxID=182803 RepID=A0A4Y2WPZ8_ARAVE|nr:hypothetical protein AVEN_155701-1 [Araneus ventricosus]
MTHAPSPEEDREAADRRAGIQSGVLRTWLQMEVLAVMRYEWARRTSILDIHRRLQSVYGDDVMSRQMVGPKFKIPRLNRPNFFDMLSSPTPSPALFRCLLQSWVWKGAQMCLPHSALIN